MEDKNSNYKYKKQGPPRSRSASSGMKNKLPTILIPTVLTAIFLGFVSVVNADGGTYKLLEGVGALGKDSTPGFQAYMTEILRVGIAVAGLLAVAELTLGGIQYVLASASEKQASAGKERIQNALIGLVIGIAAVLILTVINPDILNSNLSIPSIGTPVSTP
ncbi:MAG: pilin [Patescibacteria group bacterium]